MKQFRSVSMLIALICLAFYFDSCGSDTEEIKVVDIVVNRPGEIPGLGNVGGQPTGTPFVLPEGVSLVGTITGSSAYTKSDSFAKDSESSLNTGTDHITKASLDIDTILGAGYHVQLFITLKNTTAKDIEVEFPAGTIIISNSNKYQNGILLSKVNITIPANKEYRIALLMFSGNLDKNSPSISETYQLGIVSNSSPIVDLCNLLVRRKINYENFEQIENGFAYQTDKLQYILWDITDKGKTIDDEQLLYIQSIPYM